ncbi:MAG: polyhydroxybutyrate depolymerase [Candidatus Poriferisodalaceae bacterium]|jgi:polyhydroxybutyrate depolymerase
MRRSLTAVFALVLLAAACSSGDTATVAEADGSDESVETTVAPVTSEVPATTSAPATTAAPATTVEAGPCDGGPVPLASSSGSLDSGGNTYNYELYIPTSFDGSPMPLVLNFHGLGSSGPEQAAFSEYTAKAQGEGFIVVHPTGLVINGASGRASWELPQLDTDLRDDVQTASELIDHVATISCIDLNRVYATGMSNGGFFSAVLACELADRIAATFSVAGTTHPDSCDPARTIPMGAIHGTGDEVVPYEGGGSTLLTGEESDAQIEFFNQVMPDEFAEFSVDNGCATSTDESIGVETTLTTYSGCDDGVEMVFYTVDGGGHTWPGTLGAALFADSFGYPTMDINATDVGWAFLSRFSLVG